MSEPLSPRARLLVGVGSVVAVSLVAATAVIVAPPKLRRRWTNERLNVLVAQRERWLPSARIQLVESDLDRSIDEFYRPKNAPLTLDDSSQLGTSVLPGSADLHNAIDENYRSKAAPRETTTCPTVLTGLDVKWFGDRAEVPPLEDAWGHPFVLRACGDYFELVARLPDGEELVRELREGQ